MTHDHDGINTAVDVLAGAIGVAAIIKWIPPLAALFTLIWTSIRIFEWIETRWFKRTK